MYAFSLQVFKVVTTDMDNPTSTVRYYFTSIAPFSPQPFAINYSTGKGNLVTCIPLTYGGFFDRSPFNFNLIAGSVYATTSLVDWTGPAEYNLSFQATDYVLTAGPETLQITLTDLKTKPQILYLDQPVNITIPEDAAVGSSIYQVKNIFQDDLLYIVMPKNYKQFFSCILQLRAIGPDLSELQYALAGVEPTTGSKYFNVNASGKNPLSNR